MEEVIQNMSAVEMDTAVQLGLEAMQALGNIGMPLLNEGLAFYPAESKFYRTFFDYAEQLSREREAFSSFFTQDKNQVIRARLILCLECYVGTISKPLSNCSIGYLDDSSDGSLCRLCGSLLGVDVAFAGVELVRSVLVELHFPSSLVIMALAS